MNDNIYNIPSVSISTYQHTMKAKPVISPLIPRVDSEWPLIDHRQTPNFQYEKIKWSKKDVITPQTIGNNGFLSSINS